MSVVPVEPNVIITVCVRTLMEDIIVNVTMDTLKWMMDTVWVRKRERERCSCALYYVYSSVAAVCDEKCQNGGDCVSPNNCSCVPGFTGAQCQYDIDECKIGIHECTHNVSKCINTHGGYFCSCAEGYQWQWKGFKGYCVGKKCH